MTRFGYHASHEQHPPGRLLEYAALAESAGFDAAMCSDHFHPWTEEQGESGFAWSWLGAALQATKSMTFGCVNAPGDRYHPAIIAQAAATLAEMYGDRFWFAVGSGEALNEHVTGAKWPPKRERNERLKECADVMRALWAGETVTHDGHVTVREARLWSRPTSPPRLVGAAVSEETAKWLGGWADGLVTTGRPKREMRRIMDAFHAGGGEGKPVLVQHGLSWAKDDATATRQAHEQWRFCTLDAETLWDLRTPAEFAKATAKVTPEQVAGKLRVSSDLARHAEWINDYVELGVAEIYLFNAGKNQREFIEAFGAKVLPQLR